MYSNGDDLIAQLNRLLEKLHQTDGNKQGSTVINIYEKGSLHVDHVENQHFYGDKWTKALQGKEPKECLPSTELSFDDNTPLSALFQKNHHKELSAMIDSWRPYLINDDPTIDALDMTSFCFDFKKTIATSIYIDICVGGGYPAAADDHRRTADGVRFRERDTDALQGLKNKKVSKTLAKFRNSLYLCSGLVVTGRCIWVVRSPRQHSITFIRKPPSRSRGKFKGILIGCLFCTRYY